ncbi:hypothetical protein SAMN05444169_7855 [Bradyrhizobium erythrophlei]|uniref:DUF4148 domain-containing protein n=2 Tax=Bradyrhizobium erythrophlei TaxID=1437360 RepID=A0A1M5TLW6_9BRAD|nr:hypothetical protein SAMN05444169_7855 [Bradyrhizobium erythrophlei]
MQPSFRRARATLDRENCLTRDTVVCTGDEGCPSMRIIRAVAMIALLAAPAFASAQGFGQNQGHVQQAGEKPAEKSRQEIEADKEAERAYHKSLSNIPDHAVSDPWGNVRSETAPKAAAKPPAKRTKIGDTAH